MKILALVTDCYGGLGGIARYNRDWLGALAQAPGVQQIDVLPRLGSVGEETLPALLRQHPPQVSIARYSFVALRLALGQRPQLILCGHLYMAPLAALLARMLGVPYWLQLHGIEAWQRPSPMRQRAAEAASLVTAVSRYTRGQFLNWAKIAPERVRVLPNTFDPRYTPGPPSVALRETYGLVGRKTLLTVGRLSPTERYKGHDRVIAALPELLFREPAVLYLIAGEGEDRERLQQLAVELGVQAAVRFAGHVSEASLPDLYRSVEVFVMPSTGEGFGIVFVEAAACGIPVIGLKAAGAWDALAEGQLGMAVQPDTTNSTQLPLLNALQDVLEHPRHSTPPKAAQRFTHENFQRHCAEMLATHLIRSTTSARA